MRITAVALCLCATSCAFGPQLKRVSVNQNEVVANSTNELLLMNVLRARDREPVHFTSISKLSGSATFTTSLGANAALKGDTATTETAGTGVLTKISNVAGTDTVTPSVGLGIGGASNLDVGVWDTQEFYQGITASVPSSTVAHYLHQGWPADLLTHLFVTSVDFVATKDAGRFKKGQLVKSIFNSPDPRAPDQQTFTDFVQCYRLTSVPKVAKDFDLVPLAALDGKLSLADLALLDGDKFDVTPAVDDQGKPIAQRWIKRKGRSSDGLALRAVGAEEGEPGCGVMANFFALDGATAPTAGAFQGEADEHSVIASGKYNVDGMEIPVQVQVVLRSTNGIVYYLGEYLRAGAAAPRVVTSEGLVPILAVTNRKPARVFASTNFKGERYYVPATVEGRLDSVAGRSSQVFSLVEQLFNLQKSAKDRPTTQTVRVVP